MSGRLLLRTTFYTSRHPIPPKVLQTRSLHVSQSHKSMLDYFRRKKDTPDSAAEEEAGDGAGQIFSLEETAQQTLTEEEIYKKRNKSKLLDYHYRLVNGSMPHPQPTSWIHHTVAYKRRMYGRYGEKSGINPGIIWPTKSELADKLEFERISNPYSIQEMIRRNKEIRAAERDEYERREKEVDERMQLLKKFKAELQSRQQEKEKQQLDSKIRKEKLMEEVRRHFGYTVDPRDERFQELMAKKEKEQRKALKEARKLEKQQKMLEKMEGPSSSTKS